MQELYHITKEEHLPSILIQGLKINSKKTGFCTKDAHARYKKHYGMQPIFLTHDIEHISKHMLTKKWVQRYKAVVLKVSIELDEANHSTGWFGCDAQGDLEPKEVRYYLNILPENIEVVNVDFNEFNMEF